MNKCGMFCILTCQKERPNTTNLLLSISEGYSVINGHVYKDIG